MWQWFRVMMGDIAKSEMQKAFTGGEQVLQRTLESIKVCRRELESLHNEIEEGIYALDHIEHRAASLRERAIKAATPTKVEPLTPRVLTASARQRE
jgi:hypothetical protein